jgi:class 3 adenylate cyclase
MDMRGPLPIDLLHSDISSDGERLVKTTGDGVLLEFSSVVDAVEFAAPCRR